MITVTPDTTDVVISTSTNTVWTYSHSCAVALAVANGIPATGPGNANTWAETYKCNLYDGTATNVGTFAADTCWTSQTSTGGDISGTVTLTGSILGENVTHNTSGKSNSNKYSWSIANPASGLDTSVSFNRVVGPTFTSDKGTQGVATTATVYGQILGCPGGNFNYSGQNPSGPAAAYLYNGFVCAGLASDSLPGNNNDSADRLDYSVPFTFTVADAGTVNFSVSAIVKDVAGSTLGSISVSASGSSQIHAENCQH